MSAEVDQVYDGVKQMISNEEIELSLLVKLLAPTMELIEKLSMENSGIEKKKVLLVVFKKIIDDSNLEEDKKKNLLQACDNVLPPMIETIVTASKGKLKINISVSKFKNCLTCIFKKKN